MSTTSNRARSAYLLLTASLALTLGLFALVSPALAVKANPKPVTFYQPDGTAFEARIFGDERGALAETASGHTIVKAADGWWVYADPDSHGQVALKETPFRVGHFSVPPDWRQHTRPVIDSKRYRIPREAIDDGTIGELFRQSQQSGFLKAANPTPTSIPVLVIMVEFSDWEHTNGAGTPVAGEPDYEPMAGQANTAPTWQVLFGDNSIAGGLNHYYQEASWGQFQWDVHVAHRGCGENGCTGGELTNDGWYVNPNTMKYWGEDRTSGGPFGSCNTDARHDIRGLITWAIQAADADVDYAQFDADNNGTISDAELMIFVVHAREGQENYGSGCDGSDPNNDHIWSHKWNLNAAVSVDGKSIPNGHVYAIEPEYSPVFNYTTNPWTLTEKYFGVGVYAHEAFHTLGATDIYDTGYDAVPGGDWCLMDSGSYNGAKSGTHPAQIHTSLKQDIKMNADSAANSYGWIPDAKIVDVESLGDGVYDIAPLGGGSNDNVLHRLISPNDSTEWFMVENRAAVGYYDPYLPEHGIVIWHRDTGAAVGNNGWPYETIVERQGLANTTEGLNSGVQGAALSLEDGQSEFTSTTDPDNALNNESSSGLSDLSCVGAESATMTYAYGNPTGPHARYTGNSVAGGTDGDPWIDNGETVTLNVGVDNSTCAGATANSVSVSLSVAASSDVPSSAVSITPASINVGNLTVGQSGNAGFSVSLACDTGYVGRSITFEYTISGGNFSGLTSTFVAEVDKDYLWTDDAESPAVNAQWSDSQPFNPSSCASASGHGRWDWQDPADRAHSGVMAYHTPEASANQSYSDPSEVWVSPNIAIPGGIDVQELSFWQSAEIPCAGSTRGRLWVSTDGGGSWTRWDAFYKDGGDLGWEQVGVDLSALAGASQVRFMFAMYTYACWAGCSATEGWYLDDIAVVADEQDGCVACTPPSAPTGLAASAPVDFQIDLSWNSVGGATEYRVYRSTTSGSGYSQIATTGSTGYSDTSVVGGTTYYYVVTAFADCESTTSNEASATATGTPPNDPPTASFTYSCTNLSCDFTDTSTDSDGTIVGWSWSFGDTNTSPSQNPTHAFASAGTYSVSLTVTDDDGAPDVFQTDVTVSDADTTPPVISNVQSSNGNGNKFTITWTTDEPATSDVIFTCCGEQPSSTLVTSHSVTFNGSKGTLYEYWVRSADAQGNSTTEGPYYHQND